MKTKEIENYILQLKDYRKELNDLRREEDGGNELKYEMIASVSSGIYNTSTKMLNLIEKM